MDTSEALNTVRQYHKLLSEQMVFNEMFLFGSYAQGHAREDSDLDVAVIVDNPPEDFFNLSPLLWKVRRAVDDRIEPILFASDHDESGFLEHIRKTGIAVK